MAIWLLAGLIWATIGINSQHVEDPEATAIGDEMSPAYYLRKASRMPVVVLGEPIRVLGTEEEGNGHGPGFVFGDGIREGDDQEDKQGDQEGGEKEDINMRKVLRALLKGEAVKIPNTWEDRPANRYPYYDHYGLGYGPLYGYGGPELWEYKIWDGEEGIH